LQARTRGRQRQGSGGGLPPPEPARGPATSGSMPV